MSQEIEDLKAHIDRALFDLKERVKALEESPLVGVSLDDLVEESRTLLDAGPTLNSNLDLKIAKFSSGKEVSS